MAEKTALRSNGMIQINVIGIDTVHDIQTAPVHIQVRPQTNKNELLNILKDKLQISIPREIHCGTIKDGDASITAL